MGGLNQSPVTVTFSLAAAQPQILIFEFRCKTIPELINLGNRISAWRGMSDPRDKKTAKSLMIDGRIGKSEG